MTIKLKDILEVVPDNEYIVISCSGVGFEECHIDGHAGAFKRCFPEILERCVESLCEDDGDLVFRLASAAEDTP